MSLMAGRPDRVVRAPEPMGAALRAGPIQPFTTTVSLGELMQPSAAITVRRLTEVSLELGRSLAPLFDDDVAWDAAEGRRFLADPDCLFLLAEADGLPCGFLTAYRLQRFDRARAEVLPYEVDVDEAYRRRGVAAALIAALNRWSVEVGATETWVLTERDNLAANALYTATGGDRDPAAVVMYSYPLGRPGPQGSGRLNPCGVTPGRVVAARSLSRPAVTAPAAAPARIARLPGPGRGGRRAS